MSEDGKLTQGPATIVPLTDPDQIPVRVINEIPHIGYFGSLFDVVLTTTFPGIGAEGKLEAHRVVAARLRFDLDFARALHEQLGNAIQALSTPPKDQVN